MTVLSPPPHDESELLIREARARQRRRKVAAAAIVAVVASGVLAVYAVVGGGSSATGTQRPGPVTSSPTCRTRQLDLRAYFVNAGAGSETTGFTFTNTSGGGCTLHGWPKVQLVMRGGRVIDPHAARIRLTPASEPLRVRTVVLRPHGAASFDVGEILQVGKRGPLDRTCSAGSREVLVTPPAARRALRLRAGLTYCGHRSLWVYPVAPGRFDTQWK